MLEVNNHKKLQMMMKKVFYNQITIKRVRKKRDQLKKKTCQKVIEAIKKKTIKLIRTSINLLAQVDFQLCQMWHQRDTRLPIHLNSAQEKAPKLKVVDLIITKAESRECNKLKVKNHPITTKVENWKPVVTVKEWSLEDHTSLTFEFDKK